MQGICAWLTQGSICFLYICIVLDLAVGVVLCKSSILKWLGVHQPSIYMHCPRSSSGCSGMQGIYAQMTGGYICFLYVYIVLDLAVDVVVCKASLLNWLGRATLGVMVFKASMLYWLGVLLPSIYRHCPRPSSGCSSMQGICAPLTGGSICLLYVCIVLDLSLGLVVCKASILDWLGGPHEV